MEDCKAFLYDQFQKYGQSITCQVNKASLLRVAPSTALATVTGRRKSTEKWHKLLSPMLWCSSATSHFLNPWASLNQKGAQRGRKKQREGQSGIKNEGRRVARRMTSFIQYMQENKKCPLKYMLTESSVLCWNCKNYHPNSYRRSLKTTTRKQSFVGSPCVPIAGCYGGNGRHILKEVRI